MEINIEKIMDEIREAAEQIRSEEPVDFETVPFAVFPTAAAVTARPFDHEQLRENAGAMNTSCTVPFYRPLPGSGIKLFIKKVIRKLIFPLMQPMADDINLFNAHTVRSMNEVVSFIDEQKKLNEEKDRQIHELRQEVDALKKELQKGLK